MQNKILSLILIMFLWLFIPSFASDIEVQPTMISRTNAQDRVWVGTFQIVWNDFIDKYVHAPVRFREGTPAFVYQLNQRTFSAADLADKCYYKYSGNIKKNTVQNIKKSILSKFNETSDILDNLYLYPSYNNFLIYVMLKKDFEFLNEFDKLGKSSFGKNMTAEYFGIDKNTLPENKKILKSGVKVLYYNNPDDFALVLLTKTSDELYLYKSNANKEFMSLYKDMNTKAAGYKGEKTLLSEDELKVPNIKFDVTKIFDELCDKRIMGTNYTITQAIETIKFNMDNKGVQLKSEAAMTFVESIAPLKEKNKPRYFYLDNTFVIFLKENGKANPYFALRVNDIDKFQ